MSTVLPIGYVTLLEAADIIDRTLQAGIPDLPIVAKLRDQGFKVNDGSARDLAIAELWNAVDQGALRPVAIGGQPRRVVRLSAQFTRSVPNLRNPRGRGFTFLKPSNPAHHELVDWFGPSFHTATLAFRDMEVQKLAGVLMRRRRGAQKANGEKSRRGRAPIIGPVQTVIRDVVGRRKWNPTMTMKALIREVNRAEKGPRLISRDTVIRALDSLYKQTGDRQFERIHHKRRPRSSGGS